MTGILIKIYDNKKGNCPFTVNYTDDGFIGIDYFLN